MIKWKWNILAVAFTPEIRENLHLEEDNKARTANKPLQSEEKLLKLYLKDSTWAPDCIYPIAARLAGRELQFYELIPDDTITTVEKDNPEFKVLKRNIRKLVDHRYEPPWYLQQHLNSKDVYSKIVKVQVAPPIQLLFFPNGHFDLLKPLII
jgi:hypothetical protein